MQELSLNVLDIAQNSVRAGADRIDIWVVADRAADRLEIGVKDNGCGMTAEQVQKVTHPFFTTRTTRKVGLGVPLFKMAAEMTGGTFHIESEPGVGTSTVATFGLSHIDRMPLGDMAGTILSLMQMNPQINIVYRYQVDGQTFEASTRAFQEVLGDEVPITAPEVAQFIRQYIAENMQSLSGEAGQL